MESEKRRNGSEGKILNQNILKERIILQNIQK
jgi:hypothetical protein